MWKLHKFLNFKIRFSYLRHGSLRKNKNSFDTSWINVKYLFFLIKVTTFHIKFWFTITHLIFVSCFFSFLWSHSTHASIYVCKLMKRREKALDYETRWKMWSLRGKGGKKILNNFLNWVTWNLIYTLSRISLLI